MGVNCQTEIPAVKGLKDQEITVGRHIILKCEGAFDRAFQFQKTFIKMAPTQQNSARVLKAEAQSAAGFDVELVLYQAGEFKFSEMVLSDGKSEISLGPQMFAVQTVIEQPKDGKQPEPFGAIVPYPLSWPFIYLFVSLVIVGLLAALAVWGVRRRVYYRKLVSGLKDYESSVDPDLQFYKSLRQVESYGYPLADLEHAFRLYITRAYGLPAFHLGNRALLNFFKKNYPWHKKERLEVKKLLEEFEQMKKSTSLKDEEKKSFIKKLYAFVDHSETLLAGGRR